MKKLFAAMLALLMVCSLTACSGTNTGSTGAQEGKLDGSLTEIMGQIYDKTGDIGVMVGDPAQIDLTDENSYSYYLGVSSASDIKEAVFSEALIGSIAYSVCLVRVQDTAKVDEVKKDIYDNVNARKWICVAAEQVTVNNCGDVIILILADTQLTGTVYDGFCAVANNKVGEKLQRAGE